MSVLLSIFTGPSSAQVVIPHSVPSIESTLQPDHVFVSSFIQSFQRIKSVGASIRTANDDVSLQVGDLLFHLFNKIGVVFLHNLFLAFFGVVLPFGIDERNIDGTLDLASSIEFDFRADVKVGVASLGEKDLDCIVSSLVDIDWGTCLQ